MAIQVKVPEEAQFLVPSIVDQSRLGSRNDGGYVSPNNAWTSECSVISMGLKDDWSFESSFSKLIPQAHVLCFDPTVSAFGFLSDFVKSVLNMTQISNWSFRRRVGLVRLRLKILLAYLLFFSHPRRKHLKKWGRLSSGDDSISLSQAVILVPQSNELLIKMDIEGDEYALLEDFFTSKDFKRTRAFFIEFHEISKNWDVFSKVINRLQNDFTITHFHANNCVRELGENGLPRFVEITLLRNDLVSSSGRQLFLPIPGVDSPNKEEEPDFEIRF
jgi:hypothetical protein